MIVIVASFLRLFESEGCAIECDDGRSSKKIRLEF